MSSFTRILCPACTTNLVITHAVTNGELDLSIAIADEPDRFTAFSLTLDEAEEVITDAETFIEENDPQEKIASQDLEISRLSYENDQLQEENSRLAQKVINLLQDHAELINPRRSSAQDNQQGHRRLHLATSEAARHDLKQDLEQVKISFRNLKTAIKEAWAETKTYMEAQEAAKK